MKFTTRLLINLALSLGLTGGVLADVLVGNSPFQGGPSGQQSDGNSAIYSQTFVAPANATLESIRWWGFHGFDSGGPDFDNFVVTLDSVVQTGHLDITLDKSLGIFEYTLDISDIALTSSSLSIVNDTLDVEWYWQSAPAQGNGKAPDESQVSFNLIGRINAQTPSSPIPEPGSLSLLLLAAAALGFGKSRQEKPELLDIKNQG